jgi:hypothetical protein
MVRTGGSIPLAALALQRDMGGKRMTDARKAEMFYWAAVAASRRVETHQDGWWYATYKYRLRCMMLHGQYDPR